MSRDRQKRTNANVALQSPWVTLYNEITAIFRRDSELQISSLTEEEGGIYIFSISSSNSIKIDSISKILKNEFNFGNVKLVIEFLVEEGDIKQTVENAFRGNDIFRGIEVGGNPLIGDTYYGLFKKEVLQFFNDNIADYFGNKSILAEDIAKEIFTEDTLKQVKFCTDIRDFN